MKLKKGMAVVRSAISQGQWWRDQCSKANKNPRGVFIIDSVNVDGDPIFNCLNDGSWSAGCFELFTLEDRKLEDYL